MGNNNSKHEWHELTDKHREALDLVVAGFTSKEAAPQIGISHKGFDRRIEVACGILGVASRGEAARIHRAMSGEWGNSPWEPFPLAESGQRSDEGEAQSTDRSLVFRDALTFDGRASWDREQTELRPGIRLSDLGVSGKLVAMVCGAVALAAFVVLMLTSIAAWNSFFGA